MVTARSGCLCTTGIAKYREGMGVAIADYNADVGMDISSQTTRKNFLFKNRGVELRRSRSGVLRGLTETGSLFPAWALIFRDWNNDGMQPICHCP